MVSWYFVRLLSLSCALLAVSDIGEAGGKCNTDGCKKAAQRIKSWMDTSVKPCTNFYDFACGKFLRDTQIPPEKSSISNFVTLDDELLERLKSILTSSSTTGDSAVDQLVTRMRKYYDNCLKRDQYGSAASLLRQLFKIVPLPHINQTGWSSYGKPQFPRIMATLWYYGVMQFYDLSTMENMRDPNKMIIYIDQPSLSMGSRDYYLDDTYSDKKTAYTRLIKRMLEKIYQDLSVTGVTVDADALVELEKKMAAASDPKSARRDMKKLDRRWTLDQLKASSRKFKWGDYINQLLSYLNPRRTLPNNYEFMIASTNFMEKLDEILADSDAIDKLGQLITVKMVLGLSSMMPEEYRNMAADYTEAMYGTRGDDTRWKQCVDNVRSRFWVDLVSRLYSKVYFPPSAKAAADEMIGDVRSAFYELLKTNKWMDPETREVAKEKARAIAQRIGYPENIMNTSSLQEKYGSIPVRGHRKFFEDHLKILFLGSHKQLQKNWKPADKENWGLSPVIVNAFYKWSANQIVFPMGILSAPYFDKDYPKYLNYGGIGAVIGHEITHGFDDQGRQFDKTGTVKQWWKDETIDKFKVAAKCIADQYSRFKAPISSQELYVRGNQTQGEAIADNGGTKQAFQGYKLYVQRNGAEKGLKGLRYTPEQLFFINYGQIWCGKMREKSWVVSILNHVHPPMRFRIIGALSNNNDFKAAFNCKANDPMNPQKKCEVW